MSSPRRKSRKPALVVDEGPLYIRQWSYPTAFRSYDIGHHVRPFYYGWHGFNPMWASYMDWMDAVSGVETKDFYHRNRGNDQYLLGYI